MNNAHEVPDFSGDDFANDKEIQKQRNEAKLYAKLLDDSLNIIESHFQLTSSAHKNFKQFGMIRSLAATVNYSASGSLPPDRKLHISLIRYLSSYPIPRSPNSGTDQYIIGFIETKNDFPRTYIRRESLKEKVVDLLLKRDVDFASSKKFSRRFQVLTEDRKRLHDLLHLTDLDGLAAFPEMEVELNQKGILFRSSRKPVSISEANETVKLIDVLSGIFR